MTTNSNNIMTIGKNLRHQSMFTRLLVLCMMIGLGSGEVWGDSNNYVSLTPSPQPTGKGTIWIDGKEQSDELSDQTKYTFSLEAKPINGYSFSKWKITSNNGSVKSMSSDTDIKAELEVNHPTSNNGSSWNYTVEAYFVTYYAKVTASATNGTVKVGGGTEQTQNTATAGGSLSFSVSATPSSGYAFNGWNPATGISNASTLAPFGENTATYTVAASSTENGTASHTISANFVPRWYYNVKAQAIISGGTAGGGNVYIGTSSTGTPSQASVTVSENTKYGSSAPSAARLYVKATAAAGFEFVGWSESPTATSGDKNKTYYDVAYTSGVMPTDPTKTYYAVFQQLQTYHFKAEAKVSGNVGGTATVTPATASVQATTLAQTSATKDGFSFSAAPASKYSFTGWSETENGSIINSVANPYSISITSTSTDVNNPTTKTLWAKFTPFPTFYFKAKGEVSPAGAGTVSVTSETLSAQADVANATSFTTTASFTATSSDPAIYTFAGWKTSTSATEYASDKNPATLTLTSNSKDQTKPVTTTYYAIFNKAKDPESISVSSSSLTLKQKESQTITAILSPSGAYSNISFTSSNTGIATVDAATGKVRGVAQGSTTITVKAMKTDKTTYITTTVNVTVTDEVAQNKVGLNFNEGTKPYQVRNNSTANTVGQIVFESFNIPELELTVSNCLIVPGRDESRTDPDGNVIVDFKGTLKAGNKSVKLTGNQQLDCETFYFENSNSMPNNNLWAYSFTGWHITNTNTSSSIDAIKSGKKVPGQTVFQPGDVISPEILKEYGILDSEGNVVTNAQLNFEALWGKVVFVSDNTKVSNDTNTGNSYSKPLYNFNDNVFNKVANNNTDAYSAVMMITDYYSHNIGITRYENKAITYKSLQREVDDNGVVGDMVDGILKTFEATYDSKNPQPSNYSSWRIDNIKCSYKSNKSFKQQKGEYQEMTARMSGSLGLLIRIEPGSITDYVCVMNGGEITDSEVFGSGVDSDFKGHPRYFYFGRKAIYNFDFAVAPSTSNKAYGDCYVTVSGGLVKNLFGTGTSGQDIQGDRYFYLYGNGINETTNYEYNPNMTLCVSAGDSPLKGDAYMKIDGCTHLKDVYGGGDSYTATVQNVTLDINNSIISGSVFGGGRYGSTSGDVNLTIRNSTVNKNVYGSGMGQSTELKTTYPDKEEHSSIFRKSGLSKDGYLTAFSTAESKRQEIQGFPQYMYSTDGTTTWDKTAIPNYSVLGSRFIGCGIYGGDPYSGKYNLRFYSYFYYLSNATVEKDINITIDNSTIGQANSSDGGYVYGGGAIAKVKGDITINLNKSIVYSSVYGGGDGITQPNKVRICTFETGTAPDPEKIAEANKKDPSAWFGLETPNPFDNSDYGEDYTWSSDESKFTGYQTDHSKGINKTEKLVYTPNMDGWGDVYGRTKVSVTGGSHVYGDVFGGGNSGKVGPETGQLSDAVQTTINNSTVDGNVFGGCSNAKMSGSTEVKILGNSVIGKNVYGGGNAGEVTGKTNVQIGE